ncbi:MAG: T9SS type A sorting domain-containing protein [Bacteroidetes bacterium]|mgnify:CR=1 FL=1|jgi:hypothetical protein|nr:T9SS type A sorting domain-containing protein [Bacteroidota bacterium]MBT7827343.1 T9SS type A sorting domain-containing protein [Bacteroidota bacterium]MBT7996446.1 T9SS type A sorting domain-containing protein [Bacteroidota bacterium]
MHPTTHNSKPRKDSSLFRSFDFQFTDMIKHHLRIILFVFVALILSSWGRTGHTIISNNSTKSFNSEMKQFLSWGTELANHASDADSRKYQDPDESPRHYIDLDNYPEFVSSGRIPQSLDLVITIHGEAFVYDQGILPWATLKTYDSLKACFERSDWDKAILFASDLGHYVADGHMPMHITANYNGQFTGNYGIHSRYESSMIGDYKNEIDYAGQPIQFVSDTRQYVFDYLYQNYKYVDSILIADDAASLAAGNTSSTMYYSTLWDETKLFTIDLFAKASHALAELIYSAWYEAGTPSINTDVFEFKIIKPISLFPNPANEFTAIYFSKAIQFNQPIRIYNIQGELVKQLEVSHLIAKNGSLRIDLTKLKSGVYFVLVNEEAVKLIVVRP